MKLYRKTQRSETQAQDILWAGTQDDANKLIGRGNWEATEVPTDKAGLLAFLNTMPMAYFGKADVTQAQNENSGHNDTTPSTGHSQAKPSPHGPNPFHLRALHNIDVEDEIANADWPTIIRLAEHVHDRLDDLRRSLADQYAKMIETDPTAKRDRN